MVSDEELASLPADPEDAFIAFEKMARQRLEQHQNSDTWHAEQQYVAALRQFIIIYELRDLIDIKTPPWQGKEFGDFFSSLISEIDALTLRMRLIRARDAKKGIGNSLLIKADARTALHGYLLEMRKTLDSIDLPDGKREAILNKLNSLAREIDTNRTNWASWMALSIELADTTEAIDKRLNVLRKVYEGVLKRLGKASEEAQQLPAPDKPKRLEPPKEAKTEAASDEAS